jgi:hypothetical protein
MKKIKIIHAIHRAIKKNEVLFIYVENTFLNGEEILGISYYGILTHNDLRHFFHYSSEDLLIILKYIIIKISKNDFIKFNP